ncbi:MAG: hypothetical protein KGD63_07815 [Candidatus Lokiarchaeota archaeon]|nr:hypothetical protein [Candidatus Lokiarchaeota archaeon]
MRTLDAIKYSIGFLLLGLSISRILQFLLQPGATVAYQAFFLDLDEAYDLIQGLAIILIMFIITIPIFLIALLIYLIVIIFNLVAKNSKMVTIGTIIISLISIILGIRAIILTLGIDVVNIFYIFHLIGYIVVVALSLISFKFQLKNNENIK